MEAQVTQQNSAVTDDLQQRNHSSSYNILPPNISELRVVLLGNSWSERRDVGNLIVNSYLDTKSNGDKEPAFQTIKGQLKDKEIVLINTPDLLHPNISEEKLKGHVENCVSLSAPGPHVFLLVLQPEDFTEDHKLRLCRVLQLFSDRSFDCSVILISTPREKSSFENYMNHPPLKDMIRMCRYRYLWHKDFDRSELLTRLGQTAKENNGEHLSCDGFEDEDAGLFMRPKLVLNLVLCGRRGAGKTSAAKAILGQTELHSVSNSSESVKNQGEVCGCWVSLVELPALYGKPQEAVMEESLRCISLCDPEGVHAFILVLPVDSLTDEDKGELETIQNTFSSRVNDFTMILLTVESDPTAPAVVNFLKENKNIQELCQSCGGRSYVLNIKDKQQIPELLDTVEKVRAEGSKCFNKDVFTEAQMEKVTKLSAELQDLKQSEVGGDGGNQSRDPLRMVLIGKSGSGKSATANSILGRKHFKPRITPKPPNKSCEKVTGEVDGRPVTVVNTPALFDPTLSEDEFEQEIQNSTNMLAPGPHVFLMVLQIGNFIPEEKNSVELIKKYFGKKAKDFTIIIFTRGDDLEDQTFESYLSGCQDFVKKLINDCGGRYHVFSNKNKGDSTQVTELLTKIDTMVRENNSSCYTSEMADDTKEVSQIQVERLLKEIEEMKKKEEDLKRKHERDVKALQMKISEQREEERKLRAKQLKEKDECIQKEREERKREREGEERRRKKQEETQRQEWRRKLEDSEKRVKLEREQREAAERKLVQCRKEMKKDRDAWDKEKKEIWERTHQEQKQNLEEVKASHRKLQEEHTWRIKHSIYLWITLLLLFLLCLLYYVSH